MELMEENFLLQYDFVLRQEEISELLWLPKLVLKQTVRFYPIFKSFLRSTCSELLGIYFTTQTKADKE
jgi:hypothetical protein